MMNVIEAFLYRAFILEAQARKLKDDIPKRQKKAVVDPLNEDPLLCVLPKQRTDFA